MILDTFHGHYNSFFDSEKKIADYIIQHPKEVVNMTIKELAQAYNTSQASVSPTKALPSTTATPRRMGSSS